MNHRNPLHILNIRSGRNHISKIRNHFRVYPCLLTDIHNPLQFSIILRTKRNHNLIQFIPLQYSFQFLFIFQMGKHLISPLWILSQPVHILFCHLTLSNHQDMFLIQSLLSHFPQNCANQISRSKFQRDVYKEENTQHLS